MSSRTEGLHEMVVFSESLLNYDEKTLTTPVKPGKWSIREIMGHLYYWDRLIMESMVPLMKNGAVLPPFPNPDIYNLAAIASLEGRRALRIIEEFISVRKEFIRQLEKTEQEAVFRISGSKDESSTEKIAAFLTKHDKHHREQMETFLEEHQKRVELGHRK